MRYPFLILLLVAMMSCNNASENGDVEEKRAYAPIENEGHKHAESSTKNSKSPRRMAMAMVNGNHIHIDYSSPSMRGRKIFGGLVAYNEVWVTGAHKATNISFDRPVLISGVEVPAGKYGLFTIPGESEWTIIINKQWDMHLADDYSTKEDLLRISVKPEILDQPVESLTFKVEDNDGSANVIITWAEVQVSLSVKNID